MYLLEPIDIERITGAKQVNKQKEVLDAHGIFYVTSLDGKEINTTWHHVNHPSIAKPLTDELPDFSALG